MEILKVLYVLISFEMARRHALTEKGLQKNWSRYARTTKQDVPLALCAVECTWPWGNEGTPTRVRSLDARSSLATLLLTCPPLPAHLTPDNGQDLEKDDWALYTHREDKESPDLDTAQWGCAHSRRVESRPRLSLGMLGTLSARADLCGGQTPHQ